MQLSKVTLNIDPDISNIVYGFVTFYKEMLDIIFTTTSLISASGSSHTLASKGTGFWLTVSICTLFISLTVTSTKTGSCCME